MSTPKRRAAAALLVIAAVLALGGAAGCSSQATAPPPGPQAKMERVGNSPVPSVVLTPTGAQRIGVQTTPAAAVRAGRPLTMIPYAALLYESDGSTAVYVNTAPLTYTRYLVSVAGIAGDSVYISSGLTPGMSVVTAGAEELLGVQNGVGVET
jgi:hypothetical protein